MEFNKWSFLRNPEGIIKSWKYKCSAPEKYQTRSCMVPGRVVKLCSLARTKVSWRTFVGRDYYWCALTGKILRDVENIDYRELNAKIQGKMGRM